ncbi:MAG: DUF2061 domain-containing protein [Candidatus Hermodarchaeota archaeon]
MKTKKKLYKIKWKESVIKSIIYRSITLVLGTLTVYLITGNLVIATGTAFLTETVQSVNYFLYELTWSNISRRKFEKKIIEKIKRKEINLKLDFSSIKELAYQLSQIDTFVPKLYLSTKKIFNSMLEKEELEEIHEDIKKYKDYFESVHSGRKLFFPKEQ